jgi:hypothetical protein
LEEKESKEKNDALANETRRSVDAVYNLEKETKDEVVVRENSGWYTFDPTSIFEEDRETHDESSAGFSFDPTEVFAGEDQGVRACSENPQKRRRGSASPARCHKRMKKTEPEQPDESLALVFSSELRASIPDERLSDAPVDLWSKPDHAPCAPTLLTHSENQRRISFSSPHLNLFFNNDPP